jgi:hypothetical protein
MFAIPVDDARESRRRKVIMEFFETERAYVDGLDLIYSVSSPFFNLYSSLKR